MKSLGVGLAFAALAGAVLAAQQPPPKFSASVEVTSIDATVVDDHGRPVADLGPADFAVRIDGAQRRVVSAQWIPLATDARGGPPVEVPDGYSSNENATGGRLIVLAVDQPNIRFGANLAISHAASAFIDRLSPSDRVAVVGFGTGARSTPFTSNHERLKRALQAMSGQKESHHSVFSHQISVTEAQAIGRGDQTTLQAVQTRECLAESSNPRLADVCRGEIEIQAQQMNMMQVHEGDQTLGALRSLLAALRTIDAPKTLIMISEGFVMEDPAMVADVGGLAAAARTSVYALHLDRDAFDVSEARIAADAIGDRTAQIAGLEMLAGAARGAVFNVANSGGAVFERIEAELSGYYLLGVESDPKDRDGKGHPIRVDVGRRGTTVRTRRQIVRVAADAAPRNAREAVAQGLSSPLLLSALPVRIATYSLKGAEAGRVQLLIHADVGADYAASRPVSIGFMVFDATGKLVDSQAADQRLTPVLNGVPSPLQYTGAASLPPGEYTLKLAVAEGDRVGTVEHPVHAGLAAAGPVSLSDLTVGGPIDSGELLRPTVGYTISFGTVHGYVEAYGADLDSLSATFEVAAAADGPALLSTPVPPRPAGDQRALFTRVLPVQQLPAGKYLLRVSINQAGKALKRLTRPFEIAPPAVLLTSAEGTGEEKSIDAELFLPVSDGGLARPFKKEAALQPETLNAFRARVAPGGRTTFDQGVAFIGSGDYTKAEAAFKKAIEPDSDSTAPLVYLAVSFAAAGRDQEAASAFQTALVDGSDHPEIYEWLGGSLMRIHDLGEARSVLEEAVGKWPADARFTRPLAMVYASFGRGREAVRTLERYLDKRGDDADALYLGVEWMYHVHAAGGLVHSRAQDAKLAHAWGDAYASHGGTQTALVKQWLDFLDNEKK